MKNLHLNKNHAEESQNTSPSLIDTLKNMVNEAIDEFLFTQKRIGKDGKIFEVFKMRTMYKQADNNLPKEVLMGNKQANDNRIIPRRKWMRKSGFDEIPQGINIINGDMSIFGARPISENIRSQFTEIQMQRRNRYKPGIFGGYAFFNKGKYANKRTIRENQDLYLRLRYIKEKQGTIPVIGFNIWIFRENIKALMQGVNR